MIQFSLWIGADELNFAKSSRNFERPVDDLRAFAGVPRSVLRILEDMLFLLLP